ncbi:MAG: hypothetical protein Ct9H300mP1_13270 [Planctomycetaceae bacterium]|nr:MAG: hypothetical protein Ct9H300mP1_13270 [Planctomycetaceae bacterium]
MNGALPGDLFDPKPALKKFEGNGRRGHAEDRRITAGLLPSIRKFPPGQQRSGRQ